MYILNVTLITQGHWGRGGVKNNIKYVYFEYSTDYTMLIHTIEYFFLISGSHNKNQRWCENDNALDNRIVTQFCKKLPCFKITVYVCEFKQL